MNTKNLKLAERLNDELMVSAYNKYSIDESKEFKAFMDGARQAIASLSSIEDDIDSITIRLSDEDFDDEDIEVEEKMDDNPKTDELKALYLRCGYSPTDSDVIDINFALNGENFKFMYNISDDEWVTYDEGYAERGDEIMDIIETYAIPKRDEIVINYFFDFINKTPDAICGFVSVLEQFKTAFSNVNDKVANHGFAEFLLSMERCNKINND